MGVKNLWDILESCKRTLPLHYLQNKRVCVDLSCWVVQLHNVNKSHCSVKEKVYLKALFHRLRALIALNCSLIFVTDGSIPGIKLSTYRRRLNAGNEPIVDAGNPSNVSSLKRNMGSEFSCMIKEAKCLGVALGIPCLDGIEEAEAQCALLNSESLCDGCFTSDSDALLFGARTVYRDICLGEGGYVVCYQMDDIERELGFGRNSLISLAVLLGSDYNQGIRGFGPESACRIVKSIGELSILQKLVSDGLSISKKQKGLKKKCKDPTSKDKENYIHLGKDFNGSEHDIQTNNRFVQVINAYQRPKCHSASSNQVQRVLAVYPFNRPQLHQTCAQLFEWPPEKTDEYILPKIAERSLRRYANLRSTSSELGVDLPINEMPVKCPVSSIVKQRKVQGRNYFEVSWEDMDCLEASIVPADLVESACPEKITEFHQRKAQKQKKPVCRSRLKKTNTTDLDLEEIEKKLERLLHDIEIATTNAVNLGRLSPNNIPTILPLDDSRMHLNDKAQLDISGTAEVIDLISPTPPTRAQKPNKVECSRVDDNVIELSDTESDVSSPEHARKARELRAFMAGIRDEICLE